MASTEKHPEYPGRGQWRGIGALILGVMILSTSIIIIKKSALPPLQLTAYRLLFAAVILSPLLIRESRRLRGQFDLRTFGTGILPGICLAAHFVSWVLGARATETANASLIVNMSCIFLPFFLFLLAGERVQRREWVGTVVAILGVLTLVGSDLHFRSENLLGDGICFGSMLIFTLYLALTRKTARDSPSVWLYLPILYLSGSLSCFLVLILLGHSLRIPNETEWGYVIAITLLPTVLGHSLLNRALKQFRGQVVGVFNQTQFIFAATLGFFFFGRIPPPLFYLAALLVVAGAIVVLTGKRDEA
ncbi:MAG: DMT family transporter [Verrucomicrobiota bacterium]